MLTATEMQDDFQAEIEALMAFFDNPPIGIANHYGLLPNTPIDVLIGPDIESRVLKGSRNLFSKENQQSSMYENLLTPFMDELSAELAKHELLWRWKKNKWAFSDSVEIDAQELEYKLEPSDPRILPHMQIQAQAILQELCRRKGYKATTGIGHAHFSFRQKGHDLLQFGKSNTPTSFLFSAIAGILDFQENYPAFFIEPTRADRFNVHWLEIGFDRQYYNGPRLIAWMHDNGNMSVNSKLHKSGPRIHDWDMTVEPRLCKSSPHMSTMLNLAATKYGIQSRGLSMRPEEPNRHLDSIQISLNRDDKTLEEHMRTNTHAVQRDKKGYLYMLWQTLISLEHYDPFPDGMAQNMMRICIGEYADYLESPTAQARYDQKERNKLYESLKKLEAQVIERLTPKQTHTLSMERRAG
ncbi:MAG: hypothetical protein AB8B83_07350 [Bdellovibrionales bacterium]